MLWSSRLTQCSKCNKSVREESARKVKLFTIPNGLNGKSQQFIYWTGFLFEHLCSIRSDHLTENGSHSNVSLQLISYNFLIIESFWCSPTALVSLFLHSAAQRPHGQRHRNPCCWAHRIYSVTQLKSGLIPKAGYNIQWKEKWLNIAHDWSLVSKGSIVCNRPLVLTQQDA